jgi:DNA-directed RNA polymerase specialized sigma24 family protein
VSGSWSERSSNESGAPKFTPTADSIAAAKRREPRALAGLILYLEALLIPSAKRSRIAGHDSAELLDTFLDEFVLALPDLPIEGAEFVKYARAAFNNRLKQIVRNDQLRAEKYQRAAESGGSSDATIVAGLQSDYSVTAARQSPAESDSPSVLTRLGAHLKATLDRTDRTLLRYVIGGSPTREIASWLGIEHGACRVRIHRLRIRLREEAVCFARSSSGAERREMERFFARIGVQLNENGADNDA